MSAESVVREFFAAIYRLDFDGAIALMTDDASYHDLPLPTDPTVGKEAIRQKLGFMIAGGVERMDYEIRHLLADEAAGVVLVERSETWHFPSGATPDAAGHVHDRARRVTVARWREYWNGEELMGQMPPEFFEGIAAAGTP